MTIHERTEGIERTRIKLIEDGAPTEQIELAVGLLDYLYRKLEWGRDLNEKPENG